MYAIDGLRDALGATGGFLSSIGWRGWLKLAIVVFFLAGIGMGGSPAQTGTTGGDDLEGAQTEFESEYEAQTGEDVNWDELVASLVAVLVVVVTIAAIVWLLFTLVGSILEFVFYESLRSGSVHLRRYGRRNLGRGLRLFGFRLALSLLGVVLVAVPTLSIVRAAGGVTDVSLESLLPVVVLGVAYGLAYALLDRLTTEFVAPIMLKDGRGVLASWRRFWPTLRSSWREYFVYFVASTVLGLVVGFVVSIGLFVVALAITLPTVLVVFVLVTFAGEVGGLLSLLVIGLALVVGLVGVGLVQLPVLAYFRFYALFVLGDTNEDFDLIPDYRAAARSDDGDEFAGSNRPPGDGGDGDGDGEDYQNGDGDGDDYEYGDGDGDDYEYGDGDGEDYQNGDDRDRGW